MLPLIVVACAQFTIARDAKTVNVTTASFLNMLFLAMLMLTSSFYYDSILTELRVIIGRSPEYRLSVLLTTASGQYRSLFQTSTFVGASEIDLPTYASSSVRSETCGMQFVQPNGTTLTSAREAGLVQIANSQAIS